MNVLKQGRKLFGKWIGIPAMKYYLSQERKVRVGNIFLKIPVGVFHPTLFLSTLFLLEFIESQLIVNLKALELGAGSGLLSVAMAKQGATVTASDISEKACAAVQENGAANHVFIEVIHSDLFDAFGERKFDIIVINPPYYPRNPQNEAEKAWFCGENFEYFHKLFTQLADFIAENGAAIMVLSEDCAMDEISRSAIEAGYDWKQIAQKKKGGELNYLFEITKQKIG
jgi:release factor glutamine methyltransferase